MLEEIPSFTFFGCIALASHYIERGVYLPPEGLRCVGQPALKLVLSVGNLSLVPI